MSFVSSTFCLCKRVWKCGNERDGGLWVWICEMRVWHCTGVTVCSCVLGADALGQVLVSAVAPPQRHRQLPLDLPHALHQRGQGGPRQRGGRGSHCSVSLRHTHTPVISHAASTFRVSFRMLVNQHFFMHIYIFFNIALNEATPKTYHCIKLGHVVKKHQSWRSD